MMMRVCVLVLNLRRSESRPSRGTIRAFRIAGWIVVTVVAVTELLILFVLGGISATKVAGFYVVLAAGGLGLGCLFYVLRDAPLRQTTNVGLAEP